MLRSLVLRPLRTLTRPPPGAGILLPQNPVEALTVFLAATSGWLGLGLRLGTVSAIIGLGPAAMLALPGILAALLR